MNGHGSGGPRATFDLTAGSAMAWYFILANWPDRWTRPIIRAEGDPKTVVMPARSEAFDALRCTARLARLQGGHLAASADVVLATLDAHQSSAVGCRSHYVRAV
jgi:hypothetical protein